MHLLHLDDEWNSPEHNLCLFKWTVATNSLAFALMKGSSTNHSAGGTPNQVHTEEYLSAWLKGIIYIEIQV
jgi:hypothetical protein